ncbi:MAG: F0F1 ATP synthase subunit A [Myxococcales bacterium]|nr:F0F1 ATP synthase subunit A [Myxococcales bacterium]
MFFIFSWINFNSLFIQGVYYYQLFIPKNLPTYLIPFLMIIEIISHVAKVFSLAIRLFANIMSSHILLHILAGFTLKILDFNLILGLIPCIIILIIVFLEIGIAFLQAYVFTVLLAIYFEETFKLLELQPNLKKSEHRPLIMEYDFIN